MPQLRDPSPTADRRLEFVALVERLAEREAQRDEVTGLTAAEAAAARVRQSVGRRLVSRRHTPLGGGWAMAPGER